MEKSGLFLAGIDFIKSREGYQVLEINVSPQFKGFEKASGINVAQKVLQNLLSRRFSEKI